jgi:hypothetical protein
MISESCGFEGIVSMYAMIMISVKADASNPPSLLKDQSVYL